MMGIADVTMDGQNEAIGDALKARDAKPELAGGEDL
jgi:hypothetical protein